MEKILNNVLSLRKKGKQNRKQGRQRNQRKALQQPLAGYAYKVDNGPTRSPQMPKEFSVALTDHDIITGGGAAALRYRFGLLEYLGRLPLYLAQFYSMYKYSRVLSVQYHFEAVNTGANPIEMIFGIVPDNDVTGITPVNLVEKPGTVRRLISPQGGFDRASITKFAVAQTWMGNPYNTRDYWVTAGQAANTVSLDGEAPVGLLIMTPLTGTMGYSLSTKLVFSIQFFDLEAIPAAVNHTRDLVLAIDDSSDEEDMIKPSKLVKPKTTPKLTSRLAVKQ